MGEDARDTRNLDKRIGVIDALIPSPAQRAARIWKVIRAHDVGYTDWDIICFAAEVLGYFVPRYPWMTTVVQRLNKLVYNAHYLATEEMCLIPKNPDLDLKTKQEDTITTQVDLDGSAGGKTV
jgi:hypothetical protein